MNIMYSRRQGNVQIFKTSKFLKMYPKTYTPQRNIFMGGGVLTKSWSHTVNM